MKRGDLQPATFPSPMVGGSRFSAVKKQRTVFGGNRVKEGNPIKAIEE